MNGVEDCKERCVECGRLLDETILFTKLPHIDIYYCDECLYFPENERPLTK